VEEKQTNKRQGKLEIIEKESRKNRERMEKEWPTMEKWNILVRQWKKARRQYKHEEC